MMARSASGRTRARSGRRGRDTTAGWGWGMFARPEQSRFWLILGFVLRRRAEWTVITVTWLVVVQLETHVTPGMPGWLSPAQWAWALLAATLTVATAIPASRRFCWRRVMATITRHRIRACFLQTRTWTTNGRLPFLIWSRPTPVGVRVRVWLPAGLSVNHLERVQDELAAACWAREARIVPVSGQAAMVVVDIVRRDPLGTTQPLRPPVVEQLGPDGHPTWLPTSEEIDTHPVPTPPPIRPTPMPAPGINGAAVNGTTNGRNGKNSTSSGTVPGASADPPGVTGFGGVDVTDYV